MKKNKDILLITTEKTFYKTLKKVLGVISEINVVIVNTESKLNEILNKGTVDVILYKETTREDLYKWLWNEIRIRNKSLVPFIVLGNRSVDCTKDTRDIVFEKKGESHWYLDAPYSLSDILNAISEIEPVDVELASLIDEFGKWKGIVKEILKHEIPNKLSGGNRNKDNTKKLYSIVKDMIKEHGKYDELISKIDTEIQNVSVYDLDKKYKKLSQNSRKLSEAL